MQRGIATAFALTAALAAAAGSHAAEPFYRLQSAVTLAGPSPAWDYLSFDAARRRLFIGRRKDGVIVYDVDAGKLVGRIENAVTRLEQGTEERDGAIVYRIEDRR